ncbi:MAG TPA: HAMP domain-containing sensor histidine kinase [Nocardioides sp.]|nr:HAMP domain-containing sensor histidine kinase [Nocardioides sp.]
MRRDRQQGALNDLRGFRRQLVLLAGASAAVVAAALALVAQLVLGATTTQSVDRVVEDRTDAVVALTDAATRDDALAVPDRGVDPGVVVYDAHGRVVAGSEPPSLRATFATLSATRGPVTRDVDDRYRVGARPFRTHTGARGVVVMAEAVGPYERQETIALWVSVALGAVIVALTMAVASWISHRALSPVADMARTAEEWSEHDLERRFDLGPPTDEIRALAHTLDGLLDKVGHAIRAEQRLTSELAHELRTPLTAVQGTADLIAMRPGLDTELREDVEEVRKAARAMAATITVLLELARRGPVERAASGTAPVAAVLDRARETYPTVEAAYDGELAVDVPLEVAVRALAPVLDNAARIAGGARVEVEAGRDYVDLVVRDDGPGITDPDVLFRPGAVPGRSGLGLSLARRIARAVGGDVTVGEPGTDQARGATFVVRLPRA